MELCIKTQEIEHLQGQVEKCFNPCFNGTMYKNIIGCVKETVISSVSILVLMELCIKTKTDISWDSFCHSCFNPCFNGTMYKNNIGAGKAVSEIWVSILVLMELCIKTSILLFSEIFAPPVSILVLMELCIKTFIGLTLLQLWASFNPCFNGTMYKNIDKITKAVILSRFQSLF